ncbi:MAG TPA: peptidoglycan bridge formation glycyltransferase FemA/FemB family protein, partial [Candidatus Limnocylindrales bacterium]|nr:peptidoglycan bridge formation glycyltransferase FemA/FemB family protein [Candidatus Limnocylindrales bacterium]
MSSGLRTLGDEGAPSGPHTSSWTDETWDAFVRANERATYLQTHAWSRVKAATGWASTLIGDVGGPPGEGSRLGARVLHRPIPLLPYRFAYAPRGPITETWTFRTPLEWSVACAMAAAKGGPLERSAILRMDPEVEAGTTYHSSDQDGGNTVTLSIEELLASAGWRRAHDMQPRRTRIVDLTAEEDALWSDLRKKWRQYVNKARNAGIVVRDVDPRAEPDAFDKFYQVMREVSKRTALPLRSAATFRAVWEAFAPTGESRLQFAEAEGEVQAVLLTVRCGTRVVEPYGGMTSAGAESRANYLLKWEAIRSSREQGA